MEKKEKHKYSKDSDLLNLAGNLFMDGHYIASVGVLIDVLVSTGMIKKLFAKGGKQ